MIQKTTDYGQFKNLLGNRLMSKRHTIELIKEVKSHNLLDVIPIIVNEKMEVIDGQHRLDVARQLKLPISYAVVPGLNAQNVIRLNTSQKRWGIWDYIELWIKQGNDQYIALKEFSEKHRIQPSLAVGLLGRKVTGSLISVSFREGGFLITRQEEAEEVVRVMKKLQPYMVTEAVYNNRPFAYSIQKAMKILEKNDMSIDDLVTKYTETGRKIQFYVRVTDYMREFEDMINHGRGFKRLRFF